MDNYALERIARASLRAVIAHAITPPDAPIDVTDERAIRRRLMTDPIARYWFELGRRSAEREQDR